MWLCPFTFFLSVSDNITRSFINKCQCKISSYSLPNPYNDLILRWELIFASVSLSPVLTHQPLGMPSACVAREKSKMVNTVWSRWLVYQKIRRVLPQCLSSSIYLFIWEIRVVPSKSLYIKCLVLSWCLSWEANALMEPPQNLSSFKGVPLKHLVTVVQTDNRKPREKNIMDVSRWSQRLYWLHQLSMSTRRSHWWTHPPKWHYSGIVEQTVDTIITRIRTQKQHPEWRKSVLDGLSLQDSTNILFKKRKFESKEKENQLLYLGKGIGVGLGKIAKAVLVGTELMFADCIGASMNLLTYCIL